jgi:hypothetical protein
MVRNQSEHCPLSIVTCARDGLLPRDIDCRLRPDFTVFQAGENENTACRPAIRHPLAAEGELPSYDHVDPSPAWRVLMTNPEYKPKPTSSRQFDNSKSSRLVIVVAFVLAGVIIVLASMNKRIANDPAVIATPAPASGVVPKRETTTGQSIPPAENSRLVYQHRNG